MEILENRDEDGNFILGELPQVIGDHLVWPNHPTEHQLRTPIGEDLKKFVKDRGDLFARMVEEEAGGGVVTQGHLYKVTREWEEPLVRREVVERLPAVQEEEEEQEQEQMVGPLELCLAMLVAANRESEERMKDHDLDYMVRSRRMAPDNPEL